MTEERANKRVVWEPERLPLAARRRHKRKRALQPLPKALRTPGGCKPFSTEAYGARPYGGWSESGFSHRTRASYLWENFMTGAGQSRPPPFVVKSGAVAVSCPVLDGCFAERCISSTSVTAPGAETRAPAFGNCRTMCSPSPAVVHAVVIVVTHSSWRDKIAHARTKDVPTTFGTTVVCGLGGEDEPPHHERKSAAAVSPTNRKRTGTLAVSHRAMPMSLP